MFSYEQVQRLNDLELGVYHYVLKNKERVTTMKIRTLAEEVHVSTTTILNFCHKMDCAGYAEFKVRLHLLIENENDEAVPDDTALMLTFFEKINTPKFKEQIELSARYIAEASEIYIYGVGGSGILGQYAARYFSNFNLYATHISDPFYPVPKKVGKKAIVLVLSVTGETGMVLEQANQYKQNGFNVLSITTSADSTLAKLSDIAISYYVPIELKKSLQNITTQVPVIHIIETLARMAYTLKTKV
ncbi:MurR/RpiR family transcriptional regulator [Vagococcus intermedius]|uniref:MurR/RpiR family transcriptional regulator n=1 Tax=Vagococcus intermedius TaxID=2991418 RepID=A0AAF0CTK7_9ENTE|nr:MurR/RpiR family transcriptional regulator [Vagococcus intermedius]WEG72651.1 MurR/RpiR family transcriptional regulator [Vagococcus intermedius]WEG74736.1 MurR/RpiR family transcriptional regulator [Vagococcus intermedius]